MNKKKMMIVMPAYYAEKTLKQTLQTIPVKYKKYVILVDDASTDNTYNLAKKLGLNTYKHTNNIGYGGNQKTCYWEALKQNPDIIVMLHPDMQYDGSYIPNLIEPLIKKRCDIMLGSRIRSRTETLEGGMPIIKYIVNRIFTLTENLVLGLDLSDHFSGFRAYRREVLEKVPFQRFSNDFVFDQQLIIGAVFKKFVIDEIYIPTKYDKNSSSISYIKGIKFLVETVLMLILFVIANTGLYKSKKIV